MLLSKNDDDITYRLHLFDFKTNLYINHSFGNKKEYEDDDIDTFLCFTPATKDDYNNGWFMMELRDDNEYEIVTLIREVADVDYGFED